MKKEYKESAYVFGNDNCLVGVVTEPWPGSEKRAKVGMLLLNAGLLHHVGPNRMWVDLSRCVARLGGISFRFDLSGFGDSIAKKDALSYEERSILDIQEAMTFLQKRKKLDKFILLGFCSGAENAHRVALVDNRVAGAVFMDGWAYRTWKYFIRRYWIIMSDPIKILMFFMDKLTSLVKAFRPKSNFEEDRKQIFASDLPQKNKTESELQSMVDKNIELLFLYTKSAYLCYNYKNQFNDMYKKLTCKGKVEHHYFYKADHMYTLMEERKYAMDIILQWMQKLRAEYENA